MPPKRKAAQAYHSLLSNPVIAAGLHWMTGFQEFLNKLSTNPSHWEKRLCDNCVHVVSLLPRCHVEFGFSYFHLLFGHTLMLIKIYITFNKVKKTSYSFKRLREDKWNRPETNSGFHTVQIQQPLTECAELFPSDVHCVHLENAWPHSFFLSTWRYQVFVFSCCQWYISSCFTEGRAVEFSKYTLP